MWDTCCCQAKVGLPPHVPAARASSAAQEQPPAPSACAQPGRSGGSLGASSRGRGRAHPHRPCPPGPAGNADGSFSSEPMQCWRTTVGALAQQHLGGGQFSTLQVAGHSFAATPTSLPPGVMASPALPKGRACSGVSNICPLFPRT